MGLGIPIIDGVVKILDKIIPDKDAREKAKALLLEKQADAELEALKMAFNADVEQNKVNAAEAAHPSIFVAGWRPFIGWVCGVALAYHFVAQPALLFIFGIYEVEVKLPVFNMGELTTILMGMLGMSGLRTFEKIKDVSRDSMKG